MKMLLATCIIVWGNLRQLHFTTGAKTISDEYCTEFVSERISDRPES